MNLNQLKLFYLAIKRESLSRAARELNITQPAVTKGIQRIQEYYEVRLVQRMGKTLTLTEAGKTLYTISKKIFELERLAEDSLSEYKQQKLKHLCIHTSESFGAYFLPAIINRFNKANPDVHVTVDILPNLQVVENTIHLKNDLGFISSPIKNKKLVIRDVLEDELVIIVPPSHPFTGRAKLEPGDLEGETMIMHEEGSIFQDVIKTFMSDNGISLSMPITLSNNEAIKMAVEGKAGIAIMSKRVVAKEIQSERLVAIPISSPPLVRKFHLIHHKDKFLSGPIVDLIHMVNEWAAASRALEMSAETPSETSSGPS
jgi:DNA-binding transcriptional LysR family regulator